MKRVIVSVLTAMLIFSLCACGQAGVSQSEYDELLSEKQQIEEENNLLQDQLDKLQGEHDKIKSEYSALKKEYDDFKEQMKPYEELSVAEAEALKLKAEQEKAEAEATAAAKKAEEEAAEAARKEEEAAAKAAEEAKGYETGITYDQLARTPDEYEGKKVKFTGRVIQVIEGDGDIEIRLAVNDNYDRVIYCGYEANIVSSRVLEDDWITIYGISVGLISYESTMSGQITIPAVWVEKIDQ